jgi:hypothetical protein
MTPGKPTPEPAPEPATCALGLAPWTLAVGLAGPWLAVLHGGPVQLMAVSGLTAFLAAVGMTRAARWPLGQLRAALWLSFSAAQAARVGLPEHLLPAVSIAASAGVYAFAYPSVAAWLGTSSAPRPRSG